MYPGCKLQVSNELDTTATSQNASERKLNDILIPCATNPSFRNPVAISCGFNYPLLLGIRAAKVSLSSILYWQSLQSGTRLGACFKSGSPLEARSCAKSCQSEGEP